MEKILTISIAAYNVQKYLSACIDSLIKCKYLDKLDIIIVNDGSDDNTEDIALEYVKRFPDSIRVISKSNGGHGSTINTSIKNLTGKYFKILDADDCVNSDNLDLLVEYLSNSDVQMVLNPYYQSDISTGKRKIIYPYRDDKINISNINYLIDVPAKMIVNMHTMTFLSSVLQNNDIVIDENCYYVDTEYEIFPLKYIETVKFLNNPVYIFNVGYANQSVNASVMRAKYTEHLNVIMRLTEYYESEKNYISDKCEILIKNRISGMIKKQYYLFMGLSLKKSRDMVISFDKRLKNISPELYKYSLNHGKYPFLSRIFYYLRKTDYKLYYPIVAICRLLKIIK